MTPSPFSCTVHPYESEESGTCAYESGPSGANNAILFAGGLGDGPHTVPYVQSLARHLAETGQDYSIFEIRMRSSFTGFGYRSLKDDVADIASLVQYLRGLGKKKIVLMGHSTGSQDCMEYTLEKANPVDGFILQGSVSDREAGISFFDQETYEKSIKTASGMIAEGRGAEFLLPQQISHVFHPITAYRWHSLMAKGGDDDYFSSDLDEETMQKFWGRFEQPALVVFSGEDEHVPAAVDKQALVDSWKRAGQKVHPLSGLIPGAGHTVSQPDSREWLNERVVSFLKDI